MKRILDFKNGLLKKNNADYWILGFLLISTFIHRLWYFVIHYNILIYNSDSVTNFADVDILHGVVDLYRTPVYPYLIKFFHFLSKAKFVGMIVYFQI